MKPSYLFLLVVNLCLLGQLNFAEAENKINLVPGQRQLFLDNFAVDKTENLTRAMHTPDKRGPVLKPDMAINEIRVQTASAPVWVEDEKIYKLFYMSFPYKKQNWIADKIRPAYAISKDGKNFERPKNNTFDVVPGLEWTANKFMDVIYDAHEKDPARKYKGLLGAIGRQPVVSPDGIHWTKVDTKKLKSSDTSCLIYDQLNKRYIATLKKGTRFGRSAAVAFSKDFVTWTKPRISFHTDEKDQQIAIERIRKHLADPETQKPLFNDPDPATGWTPPKQPRHLPTWQAETYKLAVFPYEGVYIGMPQIYYPTGQRLPERNNTVGFLEIQLAFSRDPELKYESWKRLGGREPFIKTSSRSKGLVGNFDRQQIGVTNRPIIHDDEIWFYYCGFKSRIPPYQRNAKDGSPRTPSTWTPDERADYNDGWAAVCLAVLRRDGFISLDANSKGGYILTKPFEATGNELYLNVDVKKGGYAKVEVLDEDGEPFSGFEKDDCVTIDSDATKQQVSWKTGSYWKLLDGQTVQLKIYLKDASLYSFWTE